MKTAAAGYLTRRLVDVAQDVIIQIDDCGTSRGLDKDLLDDDQVELSIVGRTNLADVKVWQGRTSQGWREHRPLNCSQTKGSRR